MTKGRACWTCPIEPWDAVPHMRSSQKIARVCSQKLCVGFCKMTKLGTSASCVCVCVCLHGGFKLCFLERALGKFLIQREARCTCRVAQPCCARFCQRLHLQFNWHVIMCCCMLCANMQGLWPVCKAKGLPVGTTAISDPRVAEPCIYARS